MELVGKVKKFFPGHIHHTFNWLESPRTITAHIEFTSRCNIRCVYCASSQPGHKGTDLDVEVIRDVIQSLKTRNVKVVCVSGHGETTIYKNWEVYCSRMLDAGMPLHIISNFAKEFSRQELETLSRFRSIDISCDTRDPELFKKLRRGADLKTLCGNISKLRSTALDRGGRMPGISFSCVVSDQNVLNLLDFVSFGKDLGVTHFNFCNLTKYPDLKGTLNPKHITEMPMELLHKAEESLLETIAFLQRSGIGYDVQSGLLETLKQKPHQGAVQESPREEDPVKEQQSPSRYSSTREQGQTRDCLDPWSFTMIQANKDVLPCCWQKPICTLSRGQSLSDAFNNTWIKALRKGLLTGDLPQGCIDCPSRGWTTVTELQKKVWKYLNPVTGRLLPSSTVEIKDDILTPFQWVYGQGWYDDEVDLNIEDIEWQRWRWAAKKAVCMLENPKRNALLILRGSVDKSKHENQKIIIKVKDELLDEFSPGTATFFKEYVITAEMMGKEHEFPLTLETDKVFIPSALDPESSDSRELGMQVHQLFFGERKRD